jgi:nitrite reductase (NO-forming)
MIKHCTNYYWIFLLLLIEGLVFSLFTACSSNENASNRFDPSATAQTKAASQPSSPSHSSSVSATGSSKEEPAAHMPTVTFVLQTGIAEGRLAFIGKGGAIDGKSNPELAVKLGDVVQVILINGEGAEHNIAFPDFNAVSDNVIGKGASSVIAFRADKEGEFSYYCTLPGHRDAGMEGKILVKREIGVTPPSAVSISRDPMDLPPPIGKRPPKLVRVDLETIETEGKLSDGVTYTYWTFDGKVPGPFIRVRVGDTVEVHIKNNKKSVMVHSVDFHAVTGPGGGAVFTQVSPGGEKVFTFKALNPGLFVYHCATPMVANHISNGMYGLILVEPEGGLTPVDREFYVMQGELYTKGPFGQQGHQEFNVEKLLAETPEYIVFNGAVGALTQDHPLKAKVGETVRIFFGVGGPNHISSLHLIGEIFDRVYNQASLTAPPLTNVQTTVVPPGGATMVELKLQVPGRYILLDHAISRMERGLMGFLIVEGPENSTVFHEGKAQ